MTITKRLLAVLLAVVFVAAACGSDGDESSDAPAAPTCDQEGTLNVPDDFDTIQEAADKAAPGALVLVAEGTYEEAVNVTCPDITIRGIDRNNVVLEGGFELENGIRILETDGVVVENMTAQNYTGNGFFWTGADGYRGSYLTAIRNGDYGVYAYGSVNGVFEHSYGSGSPDAGIYIGQCGDCNAVIDDFTSEWNGLGYSGTNSTNVTIVNSTFRHNRSGIVPNAGSYEGCAPPINNTIVGNVASDNGNLETSAIAVAAEFPGVGIIITGSNDNFVARNRVDDNPVAGILVAPTPESDPIGPIIEEPDPDCTEDSVPVSDAEIAELPNPLVWHAHRNEVVDNLAQGNDANGGWDIMTVEAADTENCFSGNDAAVLSPADLEQVAPCGGPFGEINAESAALIGLLDSMQADQNDFETVELPDPGDLENMPDAATAPTEPARGPVGEIDIDAIEVPAAPTD
ncbi:MAG: right-handed parallel beta-helix repeat-containing protein [Acidimicrobiales bacterium]|nr:right-handed parallel beta-helix repeat-containing protein [Acidimicrobiales bacterium]MCB1015854.1 right-handed parallel beta-helix repeat-containing protein [Acidimicrobiales bacterium]MCB9371239.1 right-handed parallel beta-helix repeat-containing protein [Microthrixaceae bacterium]